MESICETPVYYHESCHCSQRMWTASGGLARSRYAHKITIIDDIQVGDLRVPLRDDQENL